jgi:hypothetical protein
LDRIWALPAGSTEGEGDKLLLYERRPGLRNAAEQYNFTAFTLQLTGHQDESLTGESRGGLPPTDSRFRPDKRAVEEVSTHSHTHTQTHTHTHLYTHTHTRIRAHTFTLRLFTREQFLQAREDSTKNSCFMSCILETIVPYFFFFIMLFVR